MTETNITKLPVPSFAAAFTTVESLGDPSSILAYAEPGVGKTTLIGQLIKVPGFDRGLIIDTDNGVKVFNNDPEIMKAIQDGRLNILKIDKTKPEAFQQIHAATQEVINTDFGYQFVVLDSLDVAQDAAVNYFLNNTYNESGKLDTRAAWGQISAWTGDLAWGFQNAPHFMGVLVGHSKSDEDKKTGQSTIKPKLAGSMKDNIGSIPDLLLYMWKEKDDAGVTHRVIASESDGEFSAKSRYSSLLPARLVDATMPELFAYLRGQKKGEEDAA